jgi:DNA-binding protein YbaB
VQSDGLDLDAAEQWVDGWEASIQERAEQARALSQKLAALSGTARSSDDLVEVTVDSSGAVTGIELDEGIRDQRATTTAEQIMTVMRAAQAELARQVAEAGAETVGAGSEISRAIVASFTSRLSPAEGRGDAAR